MEIYQRKQKKYSIKNLLKRNYQKKNININLKWKFVYKKFKRKNL